MYEKLKLSQEDKKYLKSVFERSMNITPLEIIEKKLHSNKRFERMIEAEDMMLDKGQVKENYLQIPIHNDKWYIKKNKIPCGGIKSLNYSIYRSPLGLITIEVYGGEKVRGEILRSENWFRKENIRFSVVYLEDEGYYQHYEEIKNPNKINDNQQLAMARIEEGKELYPKFTPFLEDFEDYLIGFKKAPSTTDENKVVKSFDNYKQFFDYVVSYVQIQFIFGVITKDETIVLYKKIKKLHNQMNELQQTWKSLNKEELEAAFRSLEANAKKLIEPRRLDVKAESIKLTNGVDKKTALMIANNVEGYLVENDAIAPSLLEIERRKDCYDEYELQDFEDQFIRMLKEALKK
jgi:hypothetical protein